MRTLPQRAHYKQLLYTNIKKGLVDTVTVAKFATDYPHLQTEINQVVQRIRAEQPRQIKLPYPNPLSDSLYLWRTVLATPQEETRWIAEWATHVATMPRTQQNFLRVSELVKNFPHPVRVRWSNQVIPALGTNVAAPQGPVVYDIDPKPQQAPPPAPLAQPQTFTAPPIQVPTKPPQSRYMRTDTPQATPVGMAESTP